LSRQLGITIVAEKGLEGAPIKTGLMNDVRVSTALDLLVRQWPVPEFGYQFTQDRIVIRRRAAQEPDEQPVETPAPSPEGSSTADVSADQPPAITVEPSAEAPSPPAETPPAVAPPEPAAPSPEPAESAADQDSTPEAVPEGKKIVHTVDIGESAWTIAKKYRVRMKDFLEWNGLKYDSILYPGDECVVYVGDVAPEPEPDAPAEPSSEQGG
jgi:LysM repeat protein